jgi:hypothetical protein
MKTNSNHSDIETQRKAETEFNGLSHFLIALPLGDSVSAAIIFHQPAKGAPIISHERGYKHFAPGGAKASEPLRNIKDSQQSTLLHNRKLRRLHQ